MDDHFDIARVFEIGKFDITRLTCNNDIYRRMYLRNETLTYGQDNTDFYAWENYANHQR